MMMVTIVCLVMVLQWKSHLAELEVEQNIQPLPKYMLYEASRLGDHVPDNLLFLQFYATIFLGFFWVFVTGSMTGGVPIWMQMCD